MKISFQGLKLLLFRLQCVTICSAFDHQVVNPYKRYPLYTHRVCKIYLGKRRNEVNYKLQRTIRNG